MSLYNMLFGQHADSNKLLAILGIDQGKVPRFRDCYWNGTHIVIHTRTGGGNREFYESIESCKENYPEYFKGASDDPDGPWNEDLRKIPGYVSDSDDEFDCTYADFLFSPPEAAVKILSQMDVGVPPSEMWQALFTALDAASHRATNPQGPPGEAPVHPAVGLMQDNPNTTKQENLP